MKITKKNGDVVEVNVGKAVAIVGGIAAVAVVGYCLHKINAKVDGLEDAIKAGVDRASKITDVTVSDAIVRTATEKAVGKATKAAAEKAVEETKEIISEEATTLVKNSVANVYATIRDGVVKKVTEEVANVDMGDLRAEVRDKASELIVSRLEADFDKAVHDYEGQLANMSKIYESIAKTMKGAVEK